MRNVVRGAASFLLQFAARVVVLSGGQIRSARAAPPAVTPRHVPPAAANGRASLIRALRYPKAP
jgi:hypothetical protein